MVCYIEIIIEFFSYFIIYYIPEFEELCKANGDSFEHFELSIRAYNRALDLVIRRSQCPAKPSANTGEKKSKEFQAAMAEKKRRENVLFLQKKLANAHNEFGGALLSKAFKQFTQHTGKNPCNVVILERNTPECCVSSHSVFI